MTDEVTEPVEPEAGSAPAENVNKVPDQIEQPPVDGQAGEQKDQKTNSDADDNAAQRNKVSAEKRIRQLTRKYREAERETEKERESRIVLEKRLDALENRIPPDPLTVRPTRDDFDTQELYEDALFEWRDATQQAEKEPEKSAEQEGSNDLVSVFEDRLLSDEALPDDAVDLILDGDWKASPAMTEYILYSEQGNALAYHLASHPEEAERIAQMPSILALRELEKVEGNLPSISNSTHTEPPPPPASTGTPGGSSGVIDHNKLTTEQWVNLRRQGKI